MCHAGPFSRPRAPGVLSPCFRPAGLDLATAGGRCHAWRSRAATSFDVFCYAEKPDTWRISGELS